jgi:hypothetical protein
MSGRGAALSELARAFLRIGALGFGGPAIIGLMQLEIEERRGWIDKPRFLEGLALLAGACTAILLRNVDAFPLMAIGALVGIVEPFLIG